jgi:hypothetical protein
MATMWLAAAVLSPGCGAARAIRGALVAAVSVVLAVVGHVLGGGRAPSLTALALATVFAAAACWALAGRQRRTVALAAASGGVQLASHLIFSSDGCHLGGTATNGLHMFVAHGVMTVVAATALARVDALVWLLYRFLLHRFGARRLTPILPPVDRVVLGRRPAATRLRCESRGSRAHPRRGPPLLAAA